ncbi:MAG: extracellular solute-binding protein [Trueperaceae bacterium]|nr:extracellular solute-binding protein [Trueperaceae bacterium]
MWWAEALAWAQDDITEVTFWGAFFNPDEVATLEQITENFNAQNPDINVTFELVPGSETEITRLMTAVAAGTGPDIYYLDRFTAAERAEAGLLTDLSAPYRGRNRR